MVAKFQTTLEQYRLEDKISRKTVVTIERFQDMAKLIVNVMGAKGQQTFRENIWAKRCFDDSVSQISGALEASGSNDDCLSALRHFLKVCPLNSPTEEMHERLGTPDSDEPCNQAFQTMRESRMLRAETLRHEFLALIWFAEETDEYTEKLKTRIPPSSKLEWLKRYSEARGRYTGQGVGWQSLFILHLVDHSDPNTASFTPEMREKMKRWISNARSDGRWLSKLYRQFGHGILCHTTIQTKTA